MGRPGVAPTMSYPYHRPRPGLLTFIGIVSLIWSSLTLIGSVVTALILLLVGAGSWFLGPLAGAVGTLVVTLVVLWRAASPSLRLSLSNAGSQTLMDDPA